MSSSRIAQFPKTKTPSKMAAWDKSRLQLIKPPSPFLDYASTIIPTDLVDVWRWCAYFAIFCPPINAAITRKSLYSVTDFTLRGGINKEEAESWTDLLTDTLKIQENRIVANLDTYVYGHVAISVLPPFKKYMVCSGCNKPYLAKISKFKVDAYSKSFKVHCKKCGGWRTAAVYDWYVKDPSGIRIKKWDPFEVTVRKTGLGGVPIYEVDFSTKFRNDIKMGKRDAFVDTPQEIVDVILNDRKFRVNNNRIFVIEEAALTPSSYSPNIQTSEGWSWPTLAAALPDAFHLKVALKGEEALLMTQLIPFRMISPASGSDSQMLIGAGAAPAWLDKVKEMVEAWEQDPASIARSPIPAQLLQFGDPARIMLPDTAIRLIMERILMATRTPPEFIWGGQSWSGAAHTMRALENEFAGVNREHTRMMRFIIKECASILDWRQPDDIYIHPVMSSDEVQKISILSSIAAQGGIPYKILHERLGMNSDAVWEDMLEEQKTRSRQQAEMNRFNLRIGLTPPPMPAGAPGAPPPQEAPPEGAPSEAPPPEEVPQEEPPVDTLSGAYDTMEELVAQVPPEGVDPMVLNKIVNAMRTESPMRRATFLQQIAQVNFEMHRAIMAAMNPMSQQTDRPLPEQLPPRRDGAV